VERYRASGERAGEAGGAYKGRLFTFDGENYGGDGEVREVGGVFSRFLVYLATIIFSFYTELKCLLAPLLKTYPCEGRGSRGGRGGRGGNNPVPSWLGRGFFSPPPLPSNLKAGLGRRCAA
jgi:hypothetical protein